MSNKHKSPAQDGIHFYPREVQPYIETERASHERRIAEAVAAERARCVAICEEVSASVNDEARGDESRLAGVG